MRLLQLHCLRFFFPLIDSQDKLVPLSPDIKALCRAWASPSRLLEGKPFATTPLSLVVTTDASYLGWGAILHPHRVSRVWSKKEALDLINSLELKAAVLLTLQNLESHVLGRSVLICSDIMTVVSFINYQGGTLSLSLCRLALDLWEWCPQRNIFPPGCSHSRRRDLCGGFSLLNDNSLINKFQSGFRPLHSTSTAMLNTTDEWLISFDSGKIVCVVLLDLKKAFDTVDFQLLLLKLRYYGADEQTIKWFASYLNGRIQSTSVNGASSTPRPVLCGIPQGSILGPLLFILHINDLPAGLKHCKVSMYADDTLLYCEGTDLNEICIKVNEDLQYVKTWLDHNKLSLNVNKTEYMLLGTRNRLNKINDNDVDIKINGKQLKRVRKCKHLGIIIDENLTWQDHVTNVQNKSGTGLYMLQTVKPYLDRNTLQIIYNAIVSSHLNYCDIVWDNCGVTLSNKLQKIQNRGARIINDTPWHSSGRENLTRLNWQSLENKREDNTAKMMFRILNNRAPPYLSDKFSYTEHRYNTRQSELNVNKIRPHSDSGKRTFLFRGAQVWNSLSEGIKSSNSIIGFNNGLRDRNTK